MFTSGICEGLDMLFALYHVQMQKEVIESEFPLEPVFEVLSVVARLLSGCSFCGHISKFGLQDRSP